MTAPEADQQAVSILRWLAIGLVVAALVSGIIANAQVGSDGRGDTAVTAPAIAGPPAGTADDHGDHGSMVLGMDADGDGQMSSAEDTVEVPIGGRVTPQSHAEAAQLLADVRASVERHGWSELAQVAADGYREMPAGGPTHLYSDAALVDGVAFDVDRPEVIVVEEGVLLGVMFLARSFSFDQPPPPGSPVNQWHYHVIDPPGCFIGLAFVAEADGRNRCAPGQEVRSRSPMMTHVWLDDEGDPFAADMG